MATTSSGSTAASAACSYVLPHGELERIRRQAASLSGGGDDDDASGQARRDAQGRRLALKEASDARISQWNDTVEVRW